MVQRLQDVTTWSSADDECRDCPLLPLCQLVSPGSMTRPAYRTAKPSTTAGCSRRRSRRTTIFGRSLYNKLGLDKQAERLIPIQYRMRGGFRWRARDKRTSACLCTSCLNGCTSCSGEVFYGDCDGSCSRRLRGCRGDCSSTCRGCSGCSGSCTGNCNSYCRFLPRNCQNSCSASCTGTCTNSCTSCTGTCTGGCQTNCTGQCDNACTGENQAELIAHLGDDAGVGKIIMASDYTEIKNAMENRCPPRGMELPQPFEKQPIRASR